MEAQPYIQNNALPSSTRSELSRCIWLPEYHEAKILLEKFIQDIDYLYHVVHVPSLPAIFNEVYACLNQQRAIKLGNMMLLLGIFASCTDCWVRSDCERGVFSISAAANMQSPL